MIQPKYRRGRAKEEGLNREGEKLIGRKGSLGERLIGGRVRGLWKELGAYWSEGLIGGRVKGLLDRKEGLIGGRVKGLLEGGAYWREGLIGGRGLLEGG